MTERTGPNERLCLVRIITFALGVSAIIGALVAFAGGTDGVQAPRGVDVQAPCQRAR